MVYVSYRICPQILYISHHGIKGQRWGTRNGPPYPLGNSDHSASERKAGWKSSLGSKSSSNDKSASSEYGSIGKNKNFRNYSRIGIKLLKAAAIGVGGYYLYKSGALDGLISNGGDIMKQSSNLAFDELTRNYEDLLKNVSNISKPSIPKTPIMKTAEEHGYKTLDRAETVNDVMRNTNPDFFKGVEDAKHNCTSCSVAAVLRMNGIDVTAKNIGRQDAVKVLDTAFNLTSKDVLSGTASKFSKSSNDAKDMILKKFGGEASSGVVKVKWKGESVGHMFNWTIENGKVSFFDAQSNRGDSVCDKYWTKGFIDPQGEFIVAKLDPSNIKWENLSKIVK